MPEAILDFSSDVNAIEPSVKLKCDLVESEVDLLDHIAHFYNVSELNCFLFRNETSLMHSLLKHISDKYVTIYSPINLQYSEIFTRHNYEIDSINRFNNINRAVKDNSVIFFTNPSFPDGVYYELEEYLNAWSNLSCTIIIDETFLEFTKNKSVIELLENYENIYIIKNISKLFGSKELTLSVLVSSKNNINNIALKESSEILNPFEKHYFQQVIKDKIYHNTFRAITIKNNLVLETILRKYDLFDVVFTSNIHTILVQIKEEYINLLKEFLLNNNIIVADCSLGESYISFNVSNEKSLRRLEKVLDSFSMKK